MISGRKGKSCKQDEVGTVGMAKVPNLKIQQAKYLLVTNRQRQDKFTKIGCCM
jgi:hypothetical protein